MNRFPTIESLQNSAIGKINPKLFVDANKMIKKNKYGNKKVTIDGYLFDSKKEARRYIQLRALQTIGEISHLSLQVPFKLSVCMYIADFEYKLKDGTLCVEDVKSTVTRKLQVYRMKKKLMEKELGIKIIES